MATTAPPGEARTGRRPSFHLWMVLLMSAFVFLGFGLTYLGPTATGTRTGDPPIVHLHGVTFFSWMLLLVVQSALVNVKNVQLHRALGTFGIAVATMVVLMGCLITIVGASGAAESQSLTSLDTAAVFFLSVFAPPSFAIIFALAIRAVKRPMVHRDLILLATISILMPGINRVYMQILSLDYTPILATYLTMDVLLAAVLLQARRTHGTIARSIWIAVAVTVVPQIINPLLSPTQGWAEFIYYLGSLVYYR